jgi:hypothetical protein
VGSLHAADEVLALQAARDVYTRRGEGNSIWVVPSAAITASDPDQANRRISSPPRTRSTATRPSTTSPMMWGICDGKPVQAAVLELADDHLILGHRLSEWCGHAPMLEEDLALPNMALDLLGPGARALRLCRQGSKGKGRSEDDLAFLRVEREYRNLLLVERPNGDFAHTMLRQLYFAPSWNPTGRLRPAVNSAVRRCGASPARRKEMAYHLRHCRRMGDPAGRRHR